MKPVERNSPNDGVGLTWDDGTPLTTSEGKAWWAGWEEGNDDGQADMEEELRDEIERLREALLKIQKRAEQQSTMPFDRHADYFRMARAALGEGKE